MESTLIDDAATGSITRKTIVACEKIFVANVERRGDEPADVDSRPLGKQHAIGVDEEDLAVGLERTKDCRWRAA